MKKVILALVIFFSSLHLAPAQQSFDDMVKSMEELQKEMLKQFGQMDIDSPGFQFFLDTIITQDFGGLNFDLNDGMFEPLDPSVFDDLFQEIQEQLSQMDEQDWNEIEKLFKGFEHILPLRPMPGDSEDLTQPEDRPASPSKKKRKIYKM